jgi:hypothetical protein
VAALAANLLSEFSFSLSLVAFLGDGAAMEGAEEGEQ